MINVLGMNEMIDFLGINEMIDLILNEPKRDFVYKTKIVKNMLFPKGISRKKINVCFEDHKTNDKQEHV
jgi:hypothetical protein